MVFQTKLKENPISMRQRVAREIEVVLHFMFASSWISVNDGKGERNGQCSIFVDDDTPEAKQNWASRNIGGFLAERTIRRKSDTFLTTFSSSDLGEPNTSFCLRSAIFGYRSV